MANIIYLDRYRKIKNEIDEKDDMKEEVWEIVTNRLLISEILKRNKKE